MNLPKYPLSSSEKMTTFEFTSEGEKGLIHKLVRFQPTNLNGLYNLAFGDKDKLTGDINDEWEDFQKDVEYQGFLIRRKK